MVSYSYDPVGNRTNRISSITGLGNQTPTYNNNDWLASDTYDNDGNTTVSGGTNYQYDYEDRLTNFNGGTYLEVTNAATDTDSPAQTLTFTLPVAPTNVAIISTNGLLSWRPLVSQANTTNPFSVVVTDNGTPPLSATQNFSVVVNPLSLRNIFAPGVSDGQIGFTFNGQVGPDYGVQQSTDLVNWTTLFITNPTVMPFSWSTNVGTLPGQFYRVEVGPPLQ